MKKSEMDWKVIKERAKAAPENFKIAILGELLTKQGLIEEINKKTEIAQEYAEMQMEYIKWCIRKVR